MSMGFLGTALRAQGYRTFAPSYGFRRSLPRILDVLGPQVEAFARAVPGQMHIVTHSLGGLVSRALIHAHRPPNLGRVVMLAPPNCGSELADLLTDLKLSGAVLGPISSHLCTRRLQRDEELLGKVDYPLGIIAGTRSFTPITDRFLPKPNDGTVSVASTILPGMADHISVPVPHTMMPVHPQSIAQVEAFLRDGRFDR